MGAYIEKADVENVFGLDNIAAWSNLEGGTTVNETRVALAIAYAEGSIEDAFRGGRYTLPFAPVPIVLKDWCAKLAGVWLFLCRPLYKKEREASEGFTDLRTAVGEEIAMYNAGQRTFNSAKSTASDVNSPTSI